MATWSNEGCTNAMKMAGQRSASVNGDCGNPSPRESATQKRAWTLAAALDPAGHSTVVQCGWSACTDMRLESLDCEAHPTQKIGYDPIIRIATWAGRLVFRTLWWVSKNLKRWIFGYLCRFGWVSYDLLPRHRRPWVGGRLGGLHSHVDDSVTPSKKKLRLWAIQTVGNQLNRQLTSLLCR